jgi:DNA-binding transcriptional regulator WhiA
VTRPERDLVAALRSELAAINPARPCDRRAEAAGLAAGRPARDGPVARLALRLDRGARVARDGRAGANETAADAQPFDWDMSAEHCRLAYLRGLFLARGSLSLASGRTHLEFVIPRGDAPLLAARLSQIGLPAASRIRRGRGVVTWKSADTVGLFLRRIGAGGALLELEARQVARALRGDLNRVLNAESANLQRAVGAAGRQIAAIDELDADGRLATQPRIVRLVADARRETPEATLGELAERLEVHRSTVQRALERIEHLALHPDEGIGRRAYGRRGVKAAPDREPVPARR